MCHCSDKRVDITASLAALQLTHAQWLNGMPTLRTLGMTDRENLIQQRSTKIANKKQRRISKEMCGL